MDKKTLKIAYVTPELYLAGGIERVLTAKANYFVEQLGYNVYIILTEGGEKPPFFKLSSKVKVINLNIGFEELWKMSFLKKIIAYHSKQRKYKRLLTSALKTIHPDITISTLRRDINFLNNIKDGSIKIGEMHVNRAHFRNFEDNNTNILKIVFSYFWKLSLTQKLRKLNRLIVLTESDRKAWKELSNVEVIPNPLPFTSQARSSLSQKRIIMIGRYSYEKGTDLLLKAWSKIEKEVQDWSLEIYGEGEYKEYEQIAKHLGIDDKRCIMHKNTHDVEKLYSSSSILVCSSRFEGFGLTIIEAMAFGIPVVSFDCEWGPHSIISEGEDGIFAKREDIGDLANKILYLIKNENKRKSMGKKAIQKAQQYDITEIIKKWQLLFDDLNTLK